MSSNDEPSHLTDGQLAEIRKIVDEAIAAHADELGQRIAAALTATMPALIGRS